MEDGVDLLSLFMQSPDVFTEDLIVDEMFDFFLAGQVTTQYASQTLIAHAAKDPDCLRKIREEFAKVMAQQPEAESGKRSKREVMDIALDTETIGDLEYLHNCMNEALRVQCPVAGPSYMWALEDTKLGGITFRKGDWFVVSSYALHLDSNQWQKPLEFIPERWDSDSPISLTPSGKKRNRHSFIPFSGGRRICFGKTLAEINIKLLAVYFLEAFDVELKDPRYKTEYPMAHIGMNKKNKVDVIFTKRK